jgi:hypothetical protein
VVAKAKKHRGNPALKKGTRPFGRKPGTPNVMSRALKDALIFAAEERQVQADIRTHLIHRPARDIFPPLGGALVFSYRV